MSRGGFHYLIITNEDDQEITIFAQHVESIVAHRKKGCTIWMNSGKFVSAKENASFVRTRLSEILRSQY